MLGWDLFAATSCFAPSFFSAPAVCFAASADLLSPPNSLVKKSKGFVGVGGAAGAGAGTVEGVAVGAGLGVEVVAVVGFIGLVVSAIKKSAFWEKGAWRKLARFY